MCQDGGPQVAIGVTTPIFQAGHAGSIPVARSTKAGRCAARVRRSPRRALALGRPRPARPRRPSRLPPDLTRCIRQALSAAGAAVFLGVSVSRSRPPRQGRLRRRMRSLRDPGPGDRSPGFGAYEELAAGLAAAGIRRGPGQADTVRQEESPPPRVPRGVQRLSSACVHRGTDRYRRGQAMGRELDIHGLRSQVWTGDRMEVIRTRAGWADQPGNAVGTGPSPYVNFPREGP